MRRCMGCMEQVSENVDVCPHCGYVRGTAPREAYHLPPEAILEGRYIVGRVLGYGGFGVTYIGWDAQLERKVAIKEFLPSTFATRMPGYTSVTVYAGEATEQFEAGLDRFVEEAQRLAKFNGVPGIVDIYDTFVQNNTAYIVMEYLQGRDVKEMLSAEGPLPYERALEIVLSVCETLAPVHEQGIIHRDIAPDNIYVTTDGQVKLLDFGASRYATSINSKSLSVILKSGYAPEEQYRSRGDQGPWSDVYALSATLYKMLTGVTPEDSMERAIRDELKEPSKLGAVLPKSAENAILNALAIRKENRTQSAAAFAEQLRADTVERVKVKPPKSDKMPPWQRALLLGSAALVLIFALLTVTGVIDLGQGNLLRDTFGSSIPDGFVNAPGIVNQQEEKAKNSVKKAGLDYQIVGTDYSDRIEKGRILSQDPTPGRLIELGAQIKVRISGGSFEDAMEAGEGAVPDLTYKTVDEARAILGELSGVSYNLDYVYSEDVAEGLVVRQEEAEEDDRHMVYLYISAGRDESSVGGIGEMRAPYVTLYSSGANLRFAVAGYGDFTGRICYAAEYSLDGETWYTLKDGEGRASTWEVSGEYGYGWDEMDTTLPYGSYHPIFSDLPLGNQHLIEREMQLRISRYHAKDNNYGSAKTYVDSMMVPISATILEALDPPVITSIQALSWEDIPQEIIEKNGSLANDYEHNAEHYTPYLVEGDFVKGSVYAIESRYSSRTWYCREDGILYISAYRDEQQPEGFWSAAVQRVGGAESVGGDAITLDVSSPAYFNMVGGEILPDAYGMEYLDFLGWLAGHLPGIDTFEDYGGLHMNYSIACDNSLPVGSVLGFTIASYTSDGYATVNVVLNAEDGATGSQILPLYSSKDVNIYEDSVFSNNELIFIPAMLLDEVNDDMARPVLELYYSVDGEDWLDYESSEFHVSSDLSSSRVTTWNYRIPAEIAGEDVVGLAQVLFERPVRTGAYDPDAASDGSPGVSPDMGRENAAAVFLSLGMEPDLIRQEYEIAKEEGWENDVFEKMGMELVHFGGYSEEDATILFYLLVEGVPEKPNEGEREESGGMSMEEAYAVMEEYGMDPQEIQDNYKTYYVNGDMAASEEFRMEMTYMIMSNGLSEEMARNIMEALLRDAAGSQGDPPDTPSGEQSPPARTETVMIAQGTFKILTLEETR